MFRFAADDCCAFSRFLGLKAFGSRREEISFAGGGDDADEEDDEAEPNDGCAFRVAIQSVLSINQPIRLVSSSPRSSAPRRHPRTHRI